MDKKAQVEQLTTYMANFVSYIGKVLPMTSKQRLTSLQKKKTARFQRLFIRQCRRTRFLQKS